MERPPPPRIALVAIDTARDIRRRYDIEWGRDLLGDWLVETRWGRIGTRGQTRTEVFTAEADATRCVPRHLRRRASSSRRIGVAYTDTDTTACAKPAPAPAPIEWTTRLREYRWVDGYDGWVEDEDDAILAVHPARGTVRDDTLLAHVRLSKTTRAWGLYADGKHIAGRELFISEWWAQEVIRARYPCAQQA